MSILFTNEQNQILDLTKNNYNIIVQAVAGAGKTTTCRCLAEGCLEKRILVLLFNRELARETKHKLKDYNVKVCTLHSFVCQYYGIDASTDEGLFFLCKHNPKPTLNEFFDLIICDEAQDYSEININSIQIIIKDFKIPQIIVMGDERQGIYEFRGSESKYLTEADTYFKNQNKWERCYLSKTFRCPSKICDLVNYSCGTEMVAAVEGGDIEYHSLEMFDKEGSNEAADMIISQIQDYLDMGYKISDMAILTHSLKFRGFSPITSVINSITKRNWPIYVPSEDQEANSKLMRGKLVFSTFHSFKGRERKIIFLLGADNYLSRFMNLNEEISLPNILYVALTRATQKLIIIQNVLYNPIPHFKSYFKLKREVIEKSPQNNDTCVKGVTDLLRFLPSQKMLELKEMLNVEILEKKKNIRVNRIQQFGYLYEDVSSICGDLVTVYKRYLTDPEGILSLFNNSLLQIAEHWSSKFLYSRYIAECYDKLDEDDELEYLAYAINITNSYRQNIIYPLKQIQHYNWVNKRWLNKACSYLEDLKNVIFEKRTSYNFDNLLITGVMDAVNETYIYEVKYTKSLTASHVLQLAAYICLEYLNLGTLNPGILINTLTGEKVKVTIKETQVLNFMNKLIK